MKLLERAIDRFGGWKLWERLDSVEFRFERLGAPLPVLKGLGRTFQKHGSVRIFPKRMTTEFPEYPSPDKKIVFQNGKVGIFNIEEEPLSFGIPNYRDTFSGFGKYRRWNALDVSYFFGYAVLQYLGVPFILREHAVRETEFANGFRIDAVFPPGAHVHCRRQSYFFDREGLLVRHDYTADVVGVWAKGAHFTSVYSEWEGLPIATERNVFVRLGTFATPIPVLSAKLAPLRVNFS
ncbi:hypothetical protein CH379_002455 [Leptospira ellisii]|uniref:Uncharacterized protein n=1 Tax=Leptospira ellisii TaxID=2023197 RepID=A0A2N0B8E4_9LEPT|nr:hypothetical protein [Leptospira ellisii]MDV6234486.1 hypothetical protein [Leptospira ellisii]PJZ92796.1 hypothetical protein CH379_11245 [Leptospira ellisii]PKA02983.1 hypothetical protein CH375_19705 [Leptospira ellisii]